jgi:hypothetical protein
MAATATIVRLVIDFPGRYFSPDYLTTEKPSVPEWVGWTGLIFAAIGTVTYIAIDFLSHKAPRE